MLFWLSALTNYKVAGSEASLKCELKKTPYCVAQAGLELRILLLLFEYWDCRCEPAQP